MPATRYDEVYVSDLSLPELGVAPRHFGDALMASATTSTDDAPATYTEAICGPDGVKWKAAIESELQSLKENGVYEIVDRPKNRKVIGSRWVLRVKRGADGEIEKFKARVVAKGYSQREGIDYNETFSPTVRFESLRALFALAASQGMEMQQMDVTTAFLYAEIDGEVYMEMPEGMVQEGKVLKLLKSIYGLKQASRLWNIHLDAVLGNMEFQKLTADFGVYVMGEGPKRTYLALYVDDLMLLNKMMGPITEVKGLLGEQFKMKDLGEVKFMLGLEVRRRENGDILLCQERYTRDVLAKFRMEDSRPASTPLDPGLKLSMVDAPKTVEEIQKMEKYPYKQALGSLLYISGGSRPDIAAAVNSLCRFSSNPGLKHWEGVLRIMRYLKGTLGEGILYRRGVCSDFMGYVDASHHTCPDTMRGRAGYVFMSAGGAISWQSKFVGNDTLSSCETEYLALAMAAQEASFLGQLQFEIKGGEFAANEVERSVIVLRTDSESAKALVENPIYHSRTKHILAKYHFIRDRVAEGEIVLEWVKSEINGADMMTKHASVGVQKTNKMLIGMV